MLLTAQAAMKWTSIYFFTPRKDIRLAAECAAVFYGAYTTGLLTMQPSPRKERRAP